MSDWISSHESSASSMNTQIQDNKKAISGHVSNADVHFTPEERTKLKGVEVNANKTVVDDKMSDTSVNPVQNKIITAKVKEIESNVSDNTEKINSLETEVSNLPEWSKSATKPTYTKAEVGLGSVDNTADADKSVKYATSAGNATKVNNHTVNADVPSGAKFTDTTYGEATTSDSGLMTSAMVTKLNGIATGANKTVVDSAMSSSSTNPVQNKVVNAALIKKGDTLIYDKDASTLYLKCGSTSLSSVTIKSGGGGATITPKPTVNPKIKNDDKKVVITWEDPTNTVIEGLTFSTWAGTKLVMKESGYPTSPDDGTVLVDNTTRDKYKTTGFEKSGLINDKQYYFALFPYSTDGVYNYDSGNRLLGEPTDLKIVTFGGTDAEIAKMIKAHYNNKINISDYWAVGDTRSVSLSAMSATGVGESHRAQTVQLVILGFEHDDLATAINGHSKAAVSVGLKDCLMDATSASNVNNGSADTEKGYMNSTNTSAGGWKNCARRTWCNNVFFSALPSTWQSMVKTVNKKVSVGNNSSTIETVQDKIFLAAEIEIFGSTTYSFAGEGTQYQYYKNATANRYKMPKWTSSYVSHIYWERSPISGSSAIFCRVGANGSADYSNASDAIGVAPCLCI